MTDQDELSYEDAAAGKTLGPLPGETSYEDAVAAAAPKTPSEYAGESTLQYMGKKFQEPAAIEQNVPWYMRAAGFPAAIAGDIWRGAKGTYETARALGAGEIDPSTPAGAEKAVETAATFLPISPAFRTGTAIAAARAARPAAVEAPFEMHPLAPVGWERPDTGARLLRPEVPHELPPDTPTTVPKPAGEAPRRQSVGALGVSGPLDDISPPTIAHMRQVLEQDGLTPATLDQRLDEMSPHQFLGELTPNTETRMSGLASLPAARSEISNAVLGRASEAAQRQRALLDEAFGPAQDLSQLQRVMTIEQQRAAGPLYEAFRSVPIPPTPELMGLLPRLRAAGAMGQARRIAGIQGIPWQDTFDMMGTAEGALRAPTAQSWDLLKQGLDAKIEASFGPLGKPTNMTRALTQLKNDLISTIDNHPDPGIGQMWRAARDTFAGPARIMQAQRFGRRLLSEAIDPNEVPFMTASYSPAEMRGVVDGVRAQFENQMGRAGPQGRRTINQVLSPNAQQKIRWTIGDGPADRLFKGFDFEDQMHNAPTRLIGGSPTASRQAAMADYAPQSSVLSPENIAHYAVAAGHFATEPISAIGKVAFHHGLRRGVQAGAQRVATAREAAAVRLQNEASRLLTLQGPERDAVLRWIMEQPLPRATGGKVGPIPSPHDMAVRASHQAWMRTNKRAAGGRIGYAEGGTPDDFTTATPTPEPVTQELQRTPEGYPYFQKLGEGDETAPVEQVAYKPKPAPLGEPALEYAKPGATGFKPFSPMDPGGGTVRGQQPTVLGPPTGSSAPFSGAPKGLDDLTVTSILHPDTPKRPSNRTVEDVAAELHARGSDALTKMGVPNGRIEEPHPDHDEIVSHALASEVQAALDRPGANAADWYTGKVREAMAVAATMHPEIETDPVAKMAYTAALAITSQGEKVPSNVRLAEDVYNYYAKNGRFPTDVKADKQKAMNTNLAKLNVLLDQHGGQGTIDFLNKQFSVRDLEAMGHTIGGENKDTQVYGSSIFGPKIGGGFYQNLNGNYDPVTMDLWFMRGWGRLTGTLVGKVDPSEQKQRLVDALREEGMRVPRDPDKLLSMSEDLMAQHERDFRTNRAAYDDGTKTKSELTYAAERYWQAINGINQSPTSGGQRNWMRDRVNRAREILGENGTNLTNADMQATWWYPEKSLYSKLGGRGKSEDLNVDYSSTLRDYAKKQGISDETIARAVSAAHNRPGSAAEGAEPAGVGAPAAGAPTARPPPGPQAGSPQERPPPAIGHNEPPELDLPGIAEARGAAGIPAGLVTRTVPSSELRTRADPHAFETQIRDPEGNLHYRGEMTREKNGLWGVGYVENLSREHSNLGVPLYRQMAKYAEDNGGTLVAGMNTNALSRTVHDKLIAAGLATPIEVGGRSLLRIRSQPAAEGFAKGGSVKRSWRDLQHGIVFQGIPIAIENAKGSMRHGVNHGKPWSVKMPADYGYFEHSNGADGDEVDAYIGPHKLSPKVFVIDQQDVENGHFDEHKVMLGFGSKEQAAATYKRGFSDGRGSERLGSITEMTIGELKAKLKKRGSFTKSIKRKAA